MSGAAIARARPCGDDHGDVASRRSRIDFDGVAAAARNALPALLNRWLPDGKRIGGEWVAKNPTRTDRHAGSFRVNMRTGRWADFATGEAGGDPIALAAYLNGLSQVEAARKVAAMLGLDPEVEQ